MNDIRRMRLAFCIAIILLVCSIFVFNPVGEGLSLLCAIFAIPFIFIFIYYFIKFKMIVLYSLVRDILNKFR